MSLYLGKLLIYNKNCASYEYADSLRTGPKGVVVNNLGPGKISFRIS